VGRRALVLMGMLLALCARAGAADPAQALMDADRAFAAQSQREGRNAAFLAWMAQQATLFREGAAPLEGREAIVASVAKWAKLDLDWHPLHADVAASGDLGYTWGEYTAKGEDAQGKPFEEHGRYVTIWRHQDGGWRWVLDIGN
jgi:ketosteroid isomerase-like protein